MTAVFPVSGVEVALWIPPVVALLVSFATSMAGISGAFLLLPFQMSVLGYTAPSVSATNHVFNVVATPSGVWRYVREGRMVWPLCLMVIAGGVPGAVAGALMRLGWLRDPGDFRVFAGLVLLVIGGRMLRDLVRGSRFGGGADDAERRFQALASHHAHEPEPCDELPVVVIRAFTPLRTRYEFCGDEFQFSTPAVAAVSFLVGVVGGIYGIGGGALIAPLLVTFFDLPVYTIAGTALMSTCVVSVAGVGIYQVLALVHPHLSVAPDWPLGLLFGAGGVAGMYLGARCQKYVPSRVIKGMLCTVILAVAARYLLAPGGP
jgi:uncharacterized membrane protein YfcA